MPCAPNLSTVGAVFARQIEAFEVEGGLYLASWHGIPDDYPMQLGDILLQLGQRPTRGIEDVLQIGLKIAPGVPIAAKLLRWNGEQFQMMAVLLPTKPSAAEFLPV